MSERPTLDVAQLIEQQPFGLARIAIVALCATVALLDGMDLQTIGLAAPAMAKQLHIAPQAFGMIFSAALLGLAIGAFVMGPMADRLGAKRVLIAATLCFGVFTTCTSWADSLGRLLSCRFLVGLGLGGAMPSFISLACEYVPTRLRATVAGVLWAGFPLGGTIGGILASRLIPAFGWQSVFLVGGAVPILLALPLAALPESLGRMVSTGMPPARVTRTLRRIFPDIALDSNARFVMTGAEGSDALAIFAPTREVGTLLLWVGFFFAFMILVVNSSWSPSLLRANGMSLAQSAIALATFNFCSIFGSGFAGWLVARFGAAFVLPVAFVTSGVAYGLIGYAAPSMGLVTLFQSLFGLFAGCASSGLIALAATFYPAQIRSAGVGWAMGVGRCGSFVGPLVVGVLVGAHWGVREIFAAVAASLLLGALASLAIGLREGRATTRYDQARQSGAP